MKFKIYFELIISIISKFNKIIRNFKLLIKNYIE
jgi:hypothetical protein